ncbi:CDP-alcohol phosphatidyltransferase family protein [Polyangium aurulentum]|uniref:CDP-alcohol phosphatidyltransferase family protein n=1 Tax=Polyangium aurulentum TaxID=2567896 RepID=UPI0010AE9505|nr:CDP-alcohol phosphatidyltransferase family protein [Polyangium aurulentum]UQA58050.1 CDP-alcohol phosphatidyltransferase family protein [Polyangium aurulentum]
MRTRLATFHAADLGRIPNLVSMMRLPLAALFPLVVENAPAALAVLAAAGLTDVLDGWLARRSGQTTTVGAVVDPIADKVFAATVVITLLSHHKMPGWALPALLSREILEAPLVLWVLLSRRFRGARKSEARANVPGKLATTVQFAAVLTAIAAPALVSVTLVAAAVSGAAAGVSYWARELGRARRLPAAPELTRSA